MAFEVVGRLAHVETIATGREIREFQRLVRLYGVARWRKRKGVAPVRLPGGKIHLAELHWYEAHGVGRKEMKIKRYLGT
ncbi:MAG: hypothetical protein M3542_07620 [Acidobacteriota bacterium]|nr:hypothetical protein [Acidobacteriota bacterium]MDQ5871201.1 hypothetical protein [Acidobacteriota bacterium]